EVSRVRCETHALLRFSQRLLFSHQFSDVHARSNIAGEISVRVISRNAVIGDPAVFAVVTPQPVLHGKRFARVERFRVSLHTLLQVIRMHVLSPAVSDLLLHGAASEIQPWLIEESAKLVDAGHPDKNGRSICNDSETCLGFAQLDLPARTFF